MQYTITIDHKELENAYDELNQLYGFMLGKGQRITQEAWPFFTQLLQAVNHLHDKQHKTQG